MTTTVSVDNFVRAETDRMFAAIQADAGGINAFRHNREPAPIDEQTVIRLNRDTLYSFAVVDISAGARVTLPDAGDRYMSAMVVNNDHYVDAIFHGAGTYELTVDQFGTEHVMVGVRTLVDPADAADIAEVSRLQDRITLEAGSARPFVSPEYDAVSFDGTRDGLLQLATFLSGFDRMFGTREEVDPVRHLIGAAAGWGGLPTSEASYVGVEPRVDPGDYEMTLEDVPVDAFWSISVYNARGFFEPTSSGRYTINSITGVPNDDGSITVRFVTDPEDPRPNAIPVPDGWNFLVRLYRPRAEVLDGTWTVPPLVPATEVSPGLQA
ncbi:DUF1214 domain-containing protein [Mumia zhuanghuii]|uniref:DUF1214 domain-containing protein n=2 Tax=Mumia TaxID=1546255 RepID=A0ABW1QRS6_9ACTN|nr:MULTISPECIES: DUF1214 domain-containing protein [Mumia]KAA1423902.1 DUF1214 domain-containing protein [Mumia zhuanghuii]